ncbi:MAG: phage tail fiber protein [Casimicrobium sp.]
MSQLTDFSENQLADWFFRGAAAPTLPASWHVALLTSAPSDAGGGTESTGGPGPYSRKAVARSTAAWAATQADGSTAATSTGTGGTTSNNALIRYDGMPASTVTHVALFDASTGGSMWAWAALNTPVVLAAGAAFEFAPAALRWTWA